MASKKSSRNQTPDYYAILGVAPGSRFRDIEAAYWAQANADENRDGLALINEAYEILGHTERRATYDATYVPSEPEPPDDDEALRGNPGLAGKLRWYLQ